MYMTDPAHHVDDIDEIKRQLKEAKGKGNFKNLFIYAPNGKENGLKIIPLSVKTICGKFRIRYNLIQSLGS